MLTQSKSTITKISKYHIYLFLKSRLFRICIRKSLLQGKRRGQFAPPKYYILMDLLRIAFLLFRPPSPSLTARHSRSAYRLVVLFSLFLDAGGFPGFYVLVLGESQQCKQFTASSYRLLGKYCPVPVFYCFLCFFLPFFFYFGNQILTLHIRNRLFDLYFPEI